MPQDDNPPANNGHRPAAWRGADAARITAADWAQLLVDNRWPLTAIALLIIAAVLFRLWGVW